jgi:hypothetical protein
LEAGGGSLFSLRLALGWSAPRSHGGFMKSAVALAKTDTTLLPDDTLLLMWAVSVSAALQWNPAAGLSACYKDRRLLVLVADLLGLQSDR